VHSGKCLHVTGASTANDAAVTQWDSVNQANLKWRFLPAGDNPSHPSSFVGHGNHVRLAVQSQLGTYLHVAGGHAGDNTRISTWTWVDQANLKWHIEPVVGKPGFFHLVSATNPNYAVHQEGAKNDNGGPCTTWNKNTHGHQGNLQLYFEPAGGEWWYIHFAHSGKCLHVSGASTANDTAVTQWDKVDQPNLKWRFIPTQ